MLRIAVVLACAVALPLQAQVYRWVDEGGEVHFSDRPPGPGSEPLAVQPNVSGSGGLRPGERQWLERIRRREAERRRPAPVQAAPPSAADQRRCARYRLRLQEQRAERRQGCRASRCPAIDRRIGYYRDLLARECP